MKKLLLVCLVAGLPSMSLKVEASAGTRAIEAQQDRDLAMARAPQPIDGGSVVGAPKAVAPKAVAPKMIVPENQLVNIANPVVRDVSPATTDLLNYDYTTPNYEKYVKQSVKLLKMPYYFYKAYDQSQKIPRIMEKFNIKDNESFDRIMMNHPGFGSYSEIEKFSVVRSDSTLQGLLNKGARVDDNLIVGVGVVFNDMSKIISNLEQQKSNLSDQNKVDALLYIEENIGKLRIKQEELLRFAETVMKKAISIKEIALKQISNNKFEFEKEKEMPKNKSVGVGTYNGAYAGS